MVSNRERFKSKSAFIRYEIRGVVIFAFFMWIWALVFYLTPEVVLTNSYIRMVVTETSAVIGMIPVFAKNSPVPLRVEFFMTLQWLLAPFYVWFVWARRDRDWKIPVSAFDKWVLGFGAIIFGISPVFLMSGPSAFNGTRLTALLIQVQSSSFFSFLNSLVWPAFTVGLVLGGLLLIHMPVKGDSKE